MNSLGYPEIIAWINPGRILEAMHGKILEGISGCILESNLRLLENILEKF